MIWFYFILVIVNAYILCSYTILPTLLFPLQIPLSSVTSIIDGLKKLYVEKLKPLEVTYRFNDFVSPLLVSYFYLYYSYHGQMPYKIHFI